ncbi:MAG: hypothetical protein K2F99_06895, partial [Muribaculaceae bacterium]|nr:hypothetical protein [Muribaculaceae bacterium]
YWTILHGAMIDVPNFNVIKASGGNGQHILVDIGWNQICDFFALVIKLEYDLQTAPTIKCINGPARPIADCFGNPVMGGYKAGSFLWVIYNEEKGVWYSLGHSQMDLTSRYPVSVSTEGDNNFHGNVPDEAIYGDDHILERVIPHNLGYKPTKIDIYPTEPPGTDSKGKPKTIGDMWWYADETNLYVGNTGNATSAFHWSVSTTDKTSDITSYLESELANIKGKSEYINYELIAVEFEEDNVSFVEIGWWDWKKDSLMVNYNQTVLLEGVDYSRSETGITFIGRRFNKGDIIQYTHSV